MDFTKEEILALIDNYIETVVGGQTAFLAKLRTMVAGEVTPEPDRDGDGIPDTIDEYPDDPTNTPPDVPDTSMTWEELGQTAWGQDLIARARTAYPSTGAWEYIAYKMTGDIQYAYDAWAKIGPIVTVKPSSANHIREQFIEYVKIYADLKNILPAEDVESYRQGLFGWAKYALGIDTPKYVGGMSVADTDNVIGSLFALAILDALEGTDYMNYHNGGAGIPVGGLNSTGIDRTTYRNCISYYCHIARGGVWPTGSSYGVGDVGLMFMGADALKELTGVDYFPEVTALRDSIGHYEALRITPDLEDNIQWGDEEHPHLLRLFYRHILLAAVGRKDVSNKLLEKYPPEISGNRPWPRYAYFKDTPNGSPVPNSLFAEGAGMFIGKMNAGKSVAWAHMPNTNEVHHDVEYFGNYQLYEDGDFVVPITIGYGSSIARAGANSFLIHGLPCMRKRGVTNYQSGDGWYAITAKTSGSLYISSYYNPPPSFVNEYRRTVVFLEPGFIIVYDNVNMVDPRTLAKFDRYRDSDQTIINSAPFSRQFVQHSQTRPTLTDYGYTYNTKKHNRPVYVRRLLPEVVHQNVIKNLDMPQHVSDSEKENWRVVYGSNDANEFLNVTSTIHAPMTKIDGGLMINNRTVIFDANGVAVS